MHTYDPALVAALTRVNLDDVLNSFGLERLRFGRVLVESPFRSSARRFARLVLDYDRYVAESGLRNGARHFMEQLNYSLTALDIKNIPSEGPLLVLSNHPGMTDTVSLFASLPRDDVRIVAAERPFLRALRATDRQLIYVPSDNEGRMGVLKAIAAHLRAGGTILTFPAGEIEPDPTVRPGAVASLDCWSSSIGALVRIVPATQIVIAFASGVLAPQALNHPLTRLRRKVKDRERLGATIQLLAKIWFSKSWKVNVQVRFSAPIAASELAPLKDSGLITQALIERARPFVTETINLAGGNL